MSTIKPRNERMALAHQAIDELRAMKRQRPFVPTPDIDIVWVLSAPGTVKEVSNDGIYQGENMNLKLVTAGVGMVREIAAKRMEIPISMVTKADIEKSGAKLLYNGESQNTEPFPGQMNTDRQNEHLRELIAEPGFLLPVSSVIVDDIPRCGTPAQVERLSEYFKENNFTGKVAVLSMVHHSIRVGRYLEHMLPLFGDSVRFVNTPLPERINAIGKTLREVRKVATYGSKTPPDLAFHNYFFTPHPLAG